MRHARIEIICLFYNYFHFTFVFNVASSNDERVALLRLRMYVQDFWLHKPFWSKKNKVNIRFLRYMLH